MPLSPSWLHRRPSVSSSASRGKSTDSYRNGHSVNPFDSNSSDSSPSTSTAAYDSSAHFVPPHANFHQHSTSLPCRHRTSILSVASDALSFRRKIGSMSRKKPYPHASLHTGHIVPGVIEISNTTVTSTIGDTTAHTDYEHEERERLRDVAAQSIGLDPELIHPSKSEGRSFLDSPRSPIQPLPLPPFPATLPALRPFMELSATLPKFTPPSSLLVYALVKQWKLRTIVLTSHSPSQKTHVHLFKGASKDEKELERLEVTENSVIFVAEEVVGGRGNVVKLAGNNVSSGATGEESLHTMWFLQIKDPAESHRWIVAIKNAVLSQRAVRAGLDISAQLDGGNEPKGDMDVMLSMHLQRIMSTHPFKASTATSGTPSPSRSPAPSLRSLKINTLSPSSTTTVKGILSGTRSRSPIEGSPTLTNHGHAEDSLSVTGTSLLTMLCPKSSTDSSCLPSHSLPLPPSHIPRQRSPAPSLRSTTFTASDLKISKERDAPDISVSDPEVPFSCTTPGSTNPSTPSIPPQGELSFSLQPPPRRCKHALATVPISFPPEPQGMYKQAGGNRSVAGNFGISSGNSGDVTPRETSPVSPDSSSFSGGQPGSFSPGFRVSSTVEIGAHVREQSDKVTRTPSGSGIATCSLPGDGSIAPPPDKLLQGTAITKRWSRQGVPLPKQLTPPSGPPPSIPPSPENNHRFSVESIPVLYAIDRSPSSSSSNLHSRARVSPRSGSSLSPMFWKRASSSSTHSAFSTSTADSQSRIRVPFGGDAHSSFGSVVANGGSLRPMSLSVHGSSPVVPIGTAKRRSMPPPRPAPNFAPPPAPTVQESMSGPASLTMTILPAPQKSLKNSLAQRALRLSLTSPKPPPSSALPLRPDEVVQRHRRSSSTGTMDTNPISVSSSRPTSPLSRNINSIKRASPPRSLSIKQRLRILSIPPVQSSSSIPSIQVSTLDLSNDDDDDLPTPYYTSPQPFGLGEHIITMESDPSFLQLSSPVTPTAPKPPPRSPSRPISPPLGGMSGLQISSLEPDCDFVALSPPPPRRGSKPHVIPVPRPEKFDVERSGSVQREESKLVTLSRRGSVVSLGFVTT